MSLPSLSTERQVTIAASFITRSTDTSCPSPLLSSDAETSSGASPFGVLRDTKRWPIECGDFVLHKDFWQGPIYVAFSCKSQIALVASTPKFPQRSDKTDSGQSTQIVGLPLSSQSATTQLCASQVIASLLRIEAVCVICSTISRARSTSEQVMLRGVERTAMGASSGVMTSAVKI